VIVIIAKTTLKSAKDRDVVLNALASATVPTLQEAGVVMYQTSIDPNDPLVLHALEIYDSEEALTAHITSRHMNALVSSISNIRADIVLKAYHGRMESFDLSAVLAREEITGASGKSNLSLSVRK